MTQSSSGGWSDPGDAALRVQAPTVQPVGERYRIDGPLGQGGMGEVFRAWDVLLDRHVALKCVHRRHDTALLRQRLLREARVTARLEHPGILPVLDAGELSDGRLFYTMRLVAGSTLAEASPSMTVGERLRHLIEAVRAVAYAHAHDTLHRDLKPSNIMVGSLGETYVVDWGLARRTQEADPSDTSNALSGPVGLTRIGTVVGTEKYLSPRGLKGQTSLSSDVFALGATVVEVLTGRQADRSAEWALLAEELADPVLRAICSRALQDASSSYPTARELLVDLTDYVENRPVGAYEYSAWEWLKHRAWRHRWPAALALTAVCVGGVVATVGAVQVITERDRALAAEREALSAQRRADRELAGSLTGRARTLAQAGALPDAELAAARAVELLPSPAAVGVLMATGAAQPVFREHEAAHGLGWHTGADGRAYAPSSDASLHIEPTSDGGFWSFGDNTATYTSAAGVPSSPVSMFGYRHDAFGDWVLSNARHSVFLASVGGDRRDVQPCGGHMIDTARLSHDGVWGVCDDDRLFHLPFEGGERFVPVADTAQYHRSAAVLGPYFWAAREDVVDEIDLRTGEIARVFAPEVGLIQQVDASDEWLMVRGADADSVLMDLSDASPLLRVPQDWAGVRMTRQGDVITTSGPNWTMAGSVGLRTQARFAEGIASIAVSPDGQTVAVARGGSRVAAVRLDSMTVAWDAQLPSTEVAKAAAFEPTGARLLASSSMVSPLYGIDPVTGSVQSDGTEVASGCRRLVWLNAGWWCIGAGRRSLVSEHEGTWHDAVRWTDMNASGQHVAIALASDGRIATLRDTAEWMDERAYGSVAIDASGGVVAWDTEEALWVRTDSQDALMLAPRPERVLDIAVSPDGQWVAASGMNVVEVWRADSGEHVASLPDLHHERVASLLFTSEWLVTSGWDGQVRKWDLTPLLDPPNAADVRVRWHLPE